MSDAERGIIREGFICAECHATFAGPEELLRHYENSHEQGTFKALLGKAKQKTKDIQQSITTNPFLQSAVTTAQPPPPPTLTYEIEPQQPGAFRCHFEDFKRHRNVKIERYASEGNKLLIRLMKLTDNVPDDPTKRKNHEQSIVNWMDEKSVNRCPDCTATFNVLLKRKHHCRLCGSILCEECSHFITLTEAIDLTKSLRNTSATIDALSKPSTKRSSSPSHVPKKEEIVFRCCIYCFRIMESRKGNYEIQESGKNLIEEHEQLKETLRHAERLIPELVKIVDSLYSGESLYSTQQANSLRGKIIKLTEKVDFLSKSIAAGAVINSSDVMLRQRIRSSTVISIRSLLSKLPVIPGDEYLNEIKTKTPVKTPSVAVVVKSAGWVSELKNVQVVDDPIQQQIINLMGFIESAKNANKLDEVDTLEKSLKELQDMKLSMSS